MRFSLWNLFVFISAAAVYLAVAFTAPVMVSVFAQVLLSLLLVPVAVTGIVYDRGYGRTFWIGCVGFAAVPYLMALSSSFTFGMLLTLEDLADATDEDSRSFVVVFAVFHTLTLVSGILAVLTRWLIERRRRAASPNAAVPLPPSSVPHRRLALQADRQE